MISLKEFLPLLLPLVDQCPSAIALIQLRLACQRFCEQSFFDQREVVLALAAGERDTVIAIDDCRVLEVVAVTGPHGALLRARGQYLAGVDNNWRHAAPGALRIYTRLGADRIGWYPPTSDDCEVTARVAVAPATAAADVGEALFTHYGQAIAYGAAAHLLLMPSRPWSMPQVAGTYASEFSAAVQRAKHDAVMRGNFSPTLDLMPRPAGYFG